MVAWLAGWLLGGPAHGAPYHSEVTLPSIAYETLRTEHFDIHYAAGDRRGRPIDAEPFAEAVAERADGLLLDLCRVLGVDVPTARIHVVVLDHEDEVAGYTLPHWSWIVLSAHPGSQLPRMRGRADLAVDALAHELAHLVSHQAATALPEAMNYGLELGGAAEGPWGGVGLRLEVDHDRPYGWSEGVAEWLSEAVGVNRWTAERAARLRSAARDGRLLTWDELQRSEDKDPGDYERAYQQGYAFARWLERTQGEGTVPAWIRARSGAGWPSWSKLLERVTGTPARQLHEAFLADVRAEARAADARATAAGLAEGEELLGWQPMWRRTERWAVDAWHDRRPREREEGREATGSWRLCPQWADGWLVDGRVGWLVASRRDEGELPGIATAWPADEVPGRPDDRWVPARFGRGFHLGPEGSLVHIAPEHPAKAVRLQDGFDLDQIWVVSLGEEARPRPVPGTLRATDLAVDPTGERVAFLRHEGGGQALVVGPVDGSAWEVVDRWGMEAHAEGLAWSPDGTRLVTSMMRGGMVDLWVMPLASGTWQALTRDRWHERDPHWSADGLWFSADVDGVQDVYVYAEGEVHQVTRQRDGAVCPSTTPGGHLLYSASTSAGVKAMGLSLARFHGGEVTERFGLDPSPERIEAALAHELPPTSFAATPYRRWHAGLPPSWGPFARVDVSGAEVSPSVGTDLSVGDALERGELSLWARVGDDHELEAQWTEQAAWPVLGLWGATRRERRWLPDGSSDRRGLDSAGAFASREVLRDVEVELGGQALRVWRASPDPRQGLQPAVEGLRARLQLTVDTLERGLDDEGIDIAVSLTSARSTQPEGSSLGVREALPWARAAVTGEGQWALGPRGALADAPHRLELRWSAGLTSADVAVDEELPVGGETPGARRATAVEPPAAMPGYVPFALAGEHVVTGGAAWALPLWPRQRRLIGAWALRRLELVVGADVGAVWRYVDDTPPPLSGAIPLADARGGLRIATLFRDARFDSQLLVAVPLREVPVDAPALGPVPAANLWPRGPRLLIGLGTGW